GAGVVPPVRAHHRGEHFGSAQCRHLVGLGRKPGGRGRRVGAGPVHPAGQLLPDRRLHAGAVWGRCIAMSGDPARHVPTALAALLLGIALGWGLRSCEKGGERSGGSWEAVAAYDSTLAVEVERWRAEAEAAAVQAAALAADVGRREAEAAARRPAWAAARQRLDKPDEAPAASGPMQPQRPGSPAG